MAFDVYVGLRRFLMVDPVDWGLEKPAIQARRIAARVAIAAAIGARIYPVKLPQKVTYPAMRLTVVTATAQNILNGPASYDAPLMQVDVWAREASGVTTFRTVRALGRAVRERLEAYSGDLTDDAQSPAVTVHAGISFVESSESYESDADGGVFRHLATYRIGHGVGAA